MSNISVLKSFFQINITFIFQVMLIGDSGVGKTCLLVRFKDNAFLSGSFISTVGIDFRVRIRHQMWTDVIGVIMTRLMWHNVIVK